MGAKKPKEKDVTKSKKDNKVEDRPLQTDVPNFLSRFWFAWTFPMFWNGFKRDLEEFDLVPPKSIYSSDEVGEALEKQWMEEEAISKATGAPMPSFIKVIMKTFIWSFIPGGIMQFISVAIRTGTPLLFSELLSFWSPDSTMTETTATYFALGMILANWLSSFFNHHGFLYCQQFGMKLRVATSSLMFRKIMRMNNGSLGETTAGKVVNLLSNDLQRFDMAFLFLHYVWIIPLQVAAVCWLGYMQAGYAALIGFAAMVIIALPTQAGLGSWIGKVRMRTADKTDARIKLMSEVINGIQVIKMYAWEIPFEKVVGQKRASELKEIRVATMLRTVFLGFMVFTERSALFFTILTLVLFGNPLTGNVIYPLQQFLGSAQVNVTLILPMVLSFTAELLVTSKRVGEFMSLEDRSDLASRLRSDSPTLLFKKLSLEEPPKSEKTIRPLSYRATSELSSNKHFGPGERKFRRSMSLPGDVVVQVRDVSASWTGDPNMLALKNLSMRIRKGKLCAIIGTVGSGKSSFLQLLLKELPAAQGTVSVYGSVSYACQEAWLFPSTIRENILFGMPYDPVKYRQVCKTCALQKDFQQFPYGDQTLAGERGVSLSGGQRARINLARAVYREADIYLLDDPLSAVDANVGRQLFEGCINGYLRSATRILVTHQVHFLKAADYIVVLNEGSIERMGTFDELVSSGKDFAKMLMSLQEGKDKDSESVTSKGSEKERPALMKSVSVVEGDDLPQFEEQKVAAEERQSGNLRFSVVSSYLMSGGGFCLMFLAMFAVLLAATSAGAADYWISYWTNQMAIYEMEQGGVDNMETGLDVQVGNFTTGQYLMIHGIIIVTTIVLTNLRMFPFAAMCTGASQKLHDTMFATMLKGIMRFFDTSSSGRILNRFTKDMGAIDEFLPRTLLDVLQIYATLAAILVLNALALYWTLIPSAVLLLIFVYFCKIYLNTAQSVKRLEGTTKSPVFGMVTSSLSGISTIRSCNAQDRLIKDFDKHQDMHTRAWYGYIGTAAAFGLYLDTLCLIYLSAVIFVFIYLDFGDTIPVGSVGLAVTQSNMLTMMLQHGARMLVEFLAQLTCVERVLEYTKIETETNLFEGQISLPPTWPTQGGIRFDNVFLRYSPDEAPVLKNLNLIIEPGWKVGIVGRTGAGKSSLISAMFRFAFLDGTMSIDGIDTSLIAKQTLRSKISIIPQEPVLFSASIRYNLDPFGIYSDDDIWRALEQVDLKSAIQSLDFKVTEGGSNFSVGQRQLMCLARAVLRSNTILIMDEATANVDPQTDNFIQQTIRRQFAKCTVLTIAHRLNTIMDSDRVLVMDAGNAAEFDYPYVLLTNPNSIFTSMVKETGEKNHAALLEIAKEKYFQNNFDENAK